MRMHGFVLEREEDVPEIFSRVRLWRHEATGAELLSCCNEDSNKVFGVSFRTPPEDSTGLPHILEHSVLCGSEKYPIKEPFVELLKGSLQTFLNAFTYPDKTCYPVASTNLRDFRNLTDVYLDAVFFPRISEEVLQQEGWHLERDKDGGFSIKGVVYNEMKGVFSSPESVLNRFCLHSLFPDNVYGLESGGDPEAIPNLTFAQFADFHRRYYHPSNGRFFFWGDDPEEERLEQLGGVLSRFSQSAPSPAISVQARRSEPLLAEIAYAAGEDENQGMVALNWLLSEVTDVETSMALQILDHILIGMPASPLRRALIESGLGEDLTGHGLDTELRQLTFSIGLRGIAPARAAEVESLILETLGELAEGGIPALAVEAAVNTLEFNLREHNTGRFPVGLSIMLQALTTWLHDADPLLAVRFEAPLAAVKQRIQSQTGYLEGLIRQYFLDNSHRTTVVLFPDPAQAERQAAREAERIRDMTGPLSEAQKDQLAAQAERLSVLQETPDTPEALASIPRLTVGDLPLTEQAIPATEVTAEVPLLFHDLPTTGIVYAEAWFDLSAVPEDLFPLVPLFGRALVEMGTRNRDFVNLNMTVACKTGGIYTREAILSLSGSRKAVPLLALAGKATADKLDDLMGLMREVLTETEFDAERFGCMVLEEKARMEHSLIPSGHQVVATRLRASLSAAGCLDERLGGVTALLAIRQLADRVASDWPGVRQDLERIRDLAVNRNCLSWNITAEGDSQERATSLANELARSLPGGIISGSVNGCPLPVVEEALLLPAQVNYVGQGVNLFDAGYAYHGSAQVILKHLRTGWLWEKVRVQGGAYGCFCALDRMSGAFVLSSYRDPNIARTLEVYAGAATHLAEITLGQRDLEAAIIGAIGEVDAHLLPEAKGTASFLRRRAGDSPEQRQQMRDEILSTSQDDFRNFGQILAEALPSGPVCVLGGSELESLAPQKGWNTLRLL